MLCLESEDVRKGKIVLLGTKLAPRADAGFYPGLSSENKCIRLTEDSPNSALLFRPKTTASVQ